MKKYKTKIVRTYYIKLKTFLWPKYIDIGGTKSTATIH